MDGVRGRGTENGPWLEPGAVGYNVAATYFPTLKSAVSSALRGLTAVFGMGTGVTPGVKPRRRDWAGPRVSATARIRRVSVKEG